MLHSSQVDRPGGLSYYATTSVGAGVSISILCLHSGLGHCHTAPAFSHFSIM